VTRTAGSLVLYCTGLGVTDPPLREGLAPAGLVRTAIQPTVTIAGASAALLFSGLTPGLAGVYQVNVLLPAGTPSTFDLTLDVGGHVAQLLVP
jgi:uncharacterized protein (TIGR03437 family)